MTDTAGHHWFPPMPDLAGLRPPRPRAARVRPSRGTPRPPRSAGIERWLALYLRAHL
jgi:hypothetical protein